MSVADSMTSIRARLFSSLPEDWAPKPLKRVTRFVEGPGIMATDFESDGVPLLRIAGLTGRRASLEGCNFVSPSLVEQKWSHFRVRVGDLLISGSATTGLCAEVDYETVGAIPYTGIIIIRPVEAQTELGFLRWFFLSDSFAVQVALAQTGSAMQHFGPTHLSQMLVPVPPMPVQRAISDFLDRETARIDALIAAKERLLELLVEKRRALITRAVTRGLPDESAAGCDPNASLRDSGIPWLGEVPAHWDVIALRFLVEFGSGATPNTGKAELWEGSIPWVSPKDMKQVEIVNAQDHVSEVALSESRLRVYEPGAVLIVVRGMILAHSFPVAVNRVAVTINQDMKALRCRPRLTPDFLRDYLRGNEDHMVTLTDSSAHGTRKLETDVLGRLEVVLPPLDEQARIAEHISGGTARLDAISFATDKTIQFLKERRAALITAAVTGQIDVEAA